MIKLKHLEVPATLVGGLALPVWNYPRSTQDIDLLLIVDDDAKVMRICEQLDCQPRRNPAIIELGSIRVLQTEYQPPDEYIEIDVDFLLGQSPFHTSVHGRAIPITYAGIQRSLRVATCEDLILLKLQSSRLIDLADCQRLIELNPLLDWDYLESWSRDLQLTQQLQRARTS
ncbi:MAG: hypothetical protein KDB22_12990 [Planctomycetales bacterium]|nr:hypothetical protein [Planctomycetales bacterium]